MSSHEPPPLPSRHAAGAPLPAGLSLGTIRDAVAYARERLEEDLQSFAVFDRESGEAVLGAQAWPEGNEQLFRLSQRVDAMLPVAGEVSAVRDWWLLDLPADQRLVVFLNMGARHRGVMIVNNTSRQVAKVFGNVVPALLMQCREGW